jgi:tape measure domain-containing protein
MGMGKAGSLVIELVPVMLGIGDKIVAQATGPASDAGRIVGLTLGESMTASVAKSTADVGNIVAKQVIGAAEKAGTQAGTNLAEPIVKAGTKAGQDAGKGIGDGVDKGAEKALAALKRVAAAYEDTGAAAAQFSARILQQAGQSSTALANAGRSVDSLGEAMTGAAATGERAWSRVGAALRTGALYPITAARDTLAQYGLTSGTVLALGAAGAAKMGIAFDATKESAQVAFTTMLQSGTAAAQLLNQLNDFAARTPFELGSVNQEAQRLIAFGFQAKDIIPTLTSIGDAVSGLGGDAGMIDRVTLAIGQMAAKGKVQSDEILQLTEAGIPALRILANQMGMTTGALQDMISKPGALVDAGKAIPLLLKGIEQGTHGAAGATQAFAGMMVQQSATLTGVWSNFKDNTNRALGQLFEPAMPLIKSALGTMTDGLGKVPALLTTLRTAAEPALAILAPGFRDAGRFAAELVGVVRNVWTAVQPFAVLVGGVLLHSLAGVGSLLANVVGPALLRISEWLRPLMPVIVGIAAAFALWSAFDMTLTMLAKGFMLARTAITGATIAWRLLGIAFETNPLGVIILAVVAVVAALIYAYENFAGFRAFVQAVFAAVVTAALAVRDGLVVAFHAVADAAMWLWHNAIEPAWAGIRFAFDLLVTGVRIYVGIYVAAFRLVADAAVWLWRNVIVPVADGIGLVLRVLGAIVFTILVAPFVIAFHLLRDAALALYNGVIRPVMTGIGQLFSWLHEHVISPVVGYITDKYREWQLANRILWEQYIRPILDAIRDGFHAVVGWIGRRVDDVIAGYRIWQAANRELWERYIKPVLDAIGDGFRFVAGWIGDRIDDVVTGFNIWRAAMRDLWDNHIQPILSSIEDGFKWIVDHVVKWAVDQIRAQFEAWAALGKWLWENGLKPAFDLIGDGVKAVVHVFDIAVDGIKSVWSGIKDICREPIKWVIDVVYNNGIVPTWNYIAGIFGLSKLDTFKFAGGGVVPGYAPGIDSVPALLSPGESVLTPEATRLLGVETILALNAMSGRQPGGVTNGVAHAAGGIGDFLGGVWHDVTGAVSSAFGWIASVAGDVVGGVKSLFSGVLGDNARTPGHNSLWRDAAMAPPGKVIDAVVEKVKGWFSSSAAGGTPYTGPVAAGVQQWAPLVLQALAMLGQPGTWLDTVLRRMNQESGGNPNSINNWDINAQRGDPSRGLMQVIGSTFNAYRSPALSPNIYDPLSNIYAGLHYAIVRYGSLSGLNVAGGYDDGGYLQPGITLAYNGTGKPEPVFTSAQWDSLRGTNNSPGAGAFEGRLYLDSGEFMGMVRGEVKKSQESIGAGLNYRTR